MTTAAAVVAACVNQELTLATAESLTAGLVAARLGEVPGCSAMLRGGVIAYANEVKAQVLGLDPALLERVVSEPVAAALARSVTELLHSDVGIGTTGVAGPDWLAGEPPGTVWIAVYDARTMNLRTEKLALSGDRAAVREGAVQASFDLVMRLLTEG